MYCETNEAMAKQEVTYDSIVKEINSRQFVPVYYLMGEEPYYIDRLSDYIAENVLTEEERGFNQMVIYGQDTDIGSIIAAAKRYPMMADHQVIIVKARLLSSYFQIRRTVYPPYIPCRTYHRVQ